MNKECTDFIRFITQNEDCHNKPTLINSCIDRFALLKTGALYYNQYLAVRFSYSKNKSNNFSNTILAIAKLKKFDHIPFFVVLVRKDESPLILLANSSFISKISHSSQRLSTDRLVGSFNGSDIIRKHDEITNTPKNFATLFSIHQGFSWEDNIERIVEATNKIEPHNQRFTPTAAEESNIFESVNRADSFVSSIQFKELENDLNTRCNKYKNEIFIASRIENNNIRGRLIEALITSDDSSRDSILDNLRNMEEALPVLDTKDGLADYVRHFHNKDAYVDIKTKIVYLGSNPKAYNIDKFLKQMSDERSVFLFFFIGIDNKSVFRTILCSVYHDELIQNTICQIHWAGRSTRGVTQFNGDAISAMLKSDSFNNRINIKQSEIFLKQLLNR